ncbi:hypothetical protein L2E82_45697 [Cichorium intybus]|uniref:Uncharacterized protein n=1 Tax=Cichorium intybus TaxID=13427 RepID=A0ACB8ZST9_CICIN|nr:hypothetical protein L2E82_45697 [Cichorium intybus]
MDPLRIIILTLWLIAAVSTVAGHNITDILSEFPEYSVFNDYLTKTRLDDEINSRQTITVLVLNNAVATNFTANRPLSVIKPALSIHVLLDYFDAGKLLTIGGGSMITTTLYQTTGIAAGSTGFVNITDIKGGKVEFGSAAQGSKIESLYTKTVKQFPYNISVLEISSPIIALEVLPVPSAVNIRSLLAAAGCRAFNKLITTTGVVDIYQKMAQDGLTVFAPSDAAFKATGLPDFNKLTNAELVSLLLYHAVPSYVPRITLKNEKDPLHTLATNSAGEFAFTVQSVGDSITLNSGVVDSRVLNMVTDSVPVSIFTIDSVLLPMELFATTPSPADAPHSPPETSPPSVSAPAPGSRPIASSPAPVAGSSPVIPPPASSTPPTLSPAGGAAPADNPAADMGNNNASGVDRIKVPVIFLALIMVSISVIFF